MSKYKLIKIVLFIAFIYTPLLSAQAQDINVKNKFGIGFNYPGISAQYGLTPKIVVEGKIQYADDCTVAGPRGYYFLAKLPGGTLTFAGVEIDYLFFRGSESEGTGTAFEVFGGGQYFINDEMAVEMDMGPSFIAISDKQTGESVSGIEFVLNISIIYFIR